jgi:hypothetical protein
VQREFKAGCGVSHFPPAMAGISGTNNERRKDTVKRTICALGALGHGILAGICLALSAGYDLTPPYWWLLAASCLSAATGLAIAAIDPD